MKPFTGAPIPCVADITAAVLAARYLRSGEATFENVCRRVADALGETTEEQETFYHEMASRRFLPNSPALMNAGTENGQLAACFTLPVGDSLPAIFDALKWGALIHQSGGGTGYNFSTIRPKASPVRETDGTASGPVSFMQIFNQTTEVIRQGGRRRGANMGILNADHPDILSFIRTKKTEGNLANFNISVMVTDTFMQCIRDGRMDIVWATHPATGEEVTVGAVWKAITGGIWKNGEPGILFFDEIDRHNPTPRLGTIDAVNPCGEEPLLPFESCVLGSVNLTRFVSGGHIDEAGLEKTAKIAIRMLDRIIDKNHYPLPEIETATKQTRKVGLGVMGVHDTLLMLGIPYDSAEGRAFCGHLMEQITTAAVETSRALAREHGTYPAWDKSIRGDKPVRNAALTCIAPTGSISLLAGCSPGIEPVYSYAYTRKETINTSFHMLHPLFARDLAAVARYRFASPEETDEQVNAVISHLRHTGTVQDIEWLPAPFRRLYKTATDIGWEDHIRMQAVFQKHVHAAISKTINMPETATEEDIAAAILFAWKSRLKGITCYRTGSRKEVVYAIGEETGPWPCLCSRPPEG